ncbi:branched-chain amino acid ABC transporter substrate-binding protein [Burkholderia sp. SFA1]|uniref:branched-chain amino acid ABC transporter substrate-binding protein n=1 Tax=unclassified Caballeronia TaxID=2646786 RepID=UPI0002388A14|nr:MULTISPECIES: branched-chain amino acid ABC transporter substrate-binding protein [unclassified Caballeronia]AET89545.1 ABC branched chain amino acid family transporter, periplasmic ligand binding protein [Burkholderia sp. YI23]MCE4541405.1 branched-chain amino acid ABC transporter substrate-binding protein [Caballeronia sp. PC1]MCE4569551.1 branched-chain amino acid ABC transporter substrate-binding protein [Caballeronia sp. CLC5]BBP96704.1 branched-chain amino acid ABC transporter substrat
MKNETGGRVMQWLRILTATCVALSCAAQAADLPPVKLALIEGMSGPFANAGAMVERNLRFGVERVNANGGVKLADGMHPLQLVVFDGKGSSEATLVQLRAAIDDKIGFVMQGNSSAVAAALVGAIDKQNAREPERRVLFLNYSADDPALTNDACSFWHFRFDAHAGMRMDALADALKDDRAVKKVYLLNQDYSFGHDVSREAQRALKERRPDVAIAGDEFHPIGRVKDFAPYIAKIRTSGADAVITGNWGNDLTLLVKAAREQGLDTKFYTFYGNGLGAPAALGDAGVKRVIAVADWHPNAGGAASDAYYRAFRARYPAAADDYLVARMPLMIDMLASAMTRAGSADPLAVARALEGMKFDGENFHAMTMRAEDHQVMQPLYVLEMDKAGTKGVGFDNEGSGYGFRTLLAVSADKTVPPTTCKMTRPAR